MGWRTDEETPGAEMCEDLQGPALPFGLASDPVAAEPSLRLWKPLKQWLAAADPKRTVGCDGCCCTPPLAGKPEVT